MLSLVGGAYDSDEEEAEKKPVAKKPKLNGNKKQEKHHCLCSCDDCAPLASRFCAKSVVTAGVKFRCKICKLTFAKKADAGLHCQATHGTELQEFKREKNPALFEELKEKDKYVPDAAIFAVDSVLRSEVLKKRKATSTFGEWEKRDDSLTQELMGPLPPELIEADSSGPLQIPTEFMRDQDGNLKEVEVSARGYDISAKQIEDNIGDAQMRTFCFKHILEVAPGTVRCKLCYGTFPTVKETEKHIGIDHKKEFDTEIETWLRFCRTSSRRQPPQGFVCMVCNKMFPDDASVWRHLGKEVWILNRRLHMEAFEEKKGKWLHAEEEECCGDGINVGVGVSYDTVKAFNKELEDQKTAAHLADNASGVGRGGESDEDGPEPEVDTAPRFIEEFAIK